MTKGDDWQRPLEGLRLPQHIAVIMDGNGRWAQQRGLPRIQGHYEGRKATKRCVEACAQIGVPVLSVYAFSVENWRRPQAEVKGLMELIETALREEAAELHGKNIRLRASGRLHALPAGLRAAVAEGEALTADNTGMTLNLLVNYGGRAEIVDAARALASEVARGDLACEAIDETRLAAALYSPDLPDPDLLVRPGGEHRVSNFLLWQIAYAEIVVLPVLWPDFGREHLVEVIVEFNRRSRRFGGVPGDHEADGGL